MRVLVPKKVTLSYQASFVGTALIEASDLQVILYNLITNAYQAQPENPHIQVRLSAAADKQLTAFQNHSLAYCDKHFAQLTVTDNGPGIPKEIESKMFTPFSQRRQSPMELVSAYSSSHRLLRKTIGSYK